MPCPHHRVTIVQRSEGKSAVAGAAYQSGENIYSEYDQKWKNYKADLIRQEVPKIERLKILREKEYRQLELLRKNQDTIAALKKNLIEDTETNG